MESEVVGHETVDKKEKRNINSTLPEKGDNLNESNSQGIVGKCNADIGGTTRWTLQVMVIYVTMPNISLPF